MKPPIKAFNTVYPSYTALAAAYKMDRQLVYTRIHTYKWPPEKAVLTRKHGSIRKTYSDHPLLLKYPIIFHNWHKLQEAIERLKRLKVTTLKKCITTIKQVKKAVNSPPEEKVVMGHGRYSLGRFKSSPQLAKSRGCIYLATIPHGEHSFYLKIGISKYIDANTRNNSLPSGSKILKQEVAELHRCFQAEQIILKEEKQEGFVIPPLLRFQGYSEVLMQLPLKSKVKQDYYARLKSAIEETKYYDEFIRL